MTKTGPIARSLAAALRKSDRNPQDVATAALAKTYARQLDDADELHSASLEILSTVDREDILTVRHVEKLADALAARQCVIDIGPKYLAALAALHLTTAARAAAKQTGDPAGDESDPAAAALVKLAGRARVRNAPAVDAAATSPDP